jgi:hypothetical protein
MSKYLPLLGYMLAGIEFGLFWRASRTPSKTDAVIYTVAAVVIMVPALILLNI